MSYKHLNSKTFKLPKEILIIWKKFTLKEKHADYVKVKNYLYCSTPTPVAEKYLSKSIRQ